VCYRQIIVDWYKNNNYYFKGLLISIIPIIALGKNSQTGSKKQVGEFLTEGSQTINENIENGVSTWP